MLGFWLNMFNNQSYVFIVGNPAEGELELIAKGFVQKLSKNNVVQGIGFCGGEAEKKFGVPSPVVVSLYENEEVPTTIYF